MRTAVRGLAAMFLLSAAASLCMGQTPSYLAVDLNSSGYRTIARGAGNGQQAGSGVVTGSSYSHALLWTGSAASRVDLHPAGYTYSFAMAAGGGQQGGYGQGPGGQRALLWNGTAASCVDLTPAGYTYPEVSGVADGQQVGHGYMPYPHALLWKGTAASRVDLNPAGFVSSQATGIGGGQQVGYGTTRTTADGYHALMWSGTAASYVDLHPSGFDQSFALAVGGGQQVGYANSGNILGPYDHPLLWQGAAASCIDLSPTGFTTGRATGVAAGRQVGYGSGPASSNQRHALLWTGTAASCIDLHAFLGPQYIDSQANGIDAQGNIVGYATYADGNAHAIMWTPVPEPATLSLLAIGGLLIARRRRA